MFEAQKATIEAKGGFFAVGAAVGEATRELVQSISERVIADLLYSVFANDEGAMMVVARSQHERAFNYFPESCQYLEGLAYGANIRVEDLLAVSYSEEMSALRYIPGARDRCSTIVSRGLNGWLVGHQEDYWKMFFGKMLVLDLRFDGYPRLVSLSYPGQLPALAGSLNAAGVAITNNSLWPKAGTGIPKQTRHFRATLQTNFMDALSTLARGPHALIDHFTLICAREDLAASVEVSNPAVSPDECVIRQIVHNEPAVLGESVAAPYVHANHVQLLSLYEADPGHLGSYMRLGKLYAEASRRAPKVMGEMLELLTRTDGILRKMPDKNLTGQKNSVTLATTVISPSESKIIFIRYGGQKPAVWQEFSL